MKRCDGRSRHGSNQVRDGIDAAPPTAEMREWFRAAEPVRSLGRPVALRDPD